MGKRGRCCCDDVCGVSIETRNPCSSPANQLVGDVEVTVYKVSDHSLVGIYTTDGTGKLDITDLIADESYDVVSYKTGSGQGVTRFTAVCGTTVVIPISSQRRAIFTGGCPGATSNRALSGTKVTITKSPDFWITGTTDSSGFFYFFSPTTGTYNYSCDAASSKFVTTSGSFSVPSLCGAGTIASVTMTVAPGHKCCSNDCDTTAGTPYRCHPYPIKFPLTVSLSTGQSFTINDCSGSQCVNVDVSAAGGPKKIVECPGSCNYDYRPDDYGPGTVPVRVSVSISTNGRLVVRVARYTENVQYSPSRNCTNSCSPKTDWRFYAWHRSDLGCPSGGGTQNTSMVVHSSEPYSATAYFDFAGVDEGEWDVDPIGPAFPISSVTVTEAG